jgi:hypothetical protein
VAKSEGVVKADDTRVFFYLEEFLRACELYAPRPERYAGRDVIVVGFRPRPGFAPSTPPEHSFARQVGVLWIDLADKTMFRRESQTVVGRCCGMLLGGDQDVLFSAVEQTRVLDGVWLPRTMECGWLFHSYHPRSSHTRSVQEFGDFKQFSTDADEVRIVAPQVGPKR